MIYIVFLSLFMFASLLDFSKKQLSQFVFFSLFFITLIFTGLRYYTGNDWSGYISYFNNVDFSDNKYEFGYKILNLICKTLFNNYYVVQFFASFLLCFSIFWFYKKNSEYKFLSLLLFIAAYFSSLFMSQVRQSIAVSILILGMKYIYNRDLKRYLIVLLFAALFHSSAIVALPIYFLFVSTKLIFKIFLLLLSLFFLCNTNVIGDCLALFVGIIPGRIGNMLENYVLSDLFNLKTELGSGTYFYAKFFLLTFIIIFYKPKSVTDHFVINCMLISCLITSMALGFSYISRLECYFGFVSILGWLKVLDISWVKKNKSIFFIVYLLIIIFFSIPYISARTATGKNRWGQPMQYTYIPYYNVFFHPENAEYRKDWCE